MPSWSEDDSDLPNWALAQASAALKIGMSVPEIEKRLVAKGLDPKTATAVVNAVLEGQLEPSPALPEEPSEDALTVHRAASAAVACLCLVLAFAFGGGDSVLRTVLWLLLPMACVWWAEVMEWRAWDSPATCPPAFIRWAGWGLLAVIAMYRATLLTT